MPDAALKARVQRLLRKEYRADDFTRLFLYARDRCDGRESVQEIGDFVAHHDQRSKGIVTRTTRDWFTTARFAMDIMHNPPNPQKLAKNFPSVLSASYRRSGHVLKKVAGIDRAKAGKLLPGIIKKLETNDDGSMRLTAEHTLDDRKVITALCGVLTASAAFDLERLFQDFSATLKSHALLEKGEMSDFQAVKGPLGLYAVTVMHNCMIEIGDGELCRLVASASAGDKIEVLSHVPVQSPTKGNIFFTSAIFTTDLHPATNCEANLLDLPRPWDCELELLQNGTLGMLA